MLVWFYRMRIGSVCVSLPLVYKPHNIFPESSTVLNKYLLNEQLMQFLFQIWGNQNQEGHITHPISYIKYVCESELEPRVSDSTFSSFLILPGPRTPKEPVRKPPASSQPEPTASSQLPGQRSAKGRMAADKLPGLDPLCPQFLCIQALVENKDVSLCFHKLLWLLIFIM